MPWLYLNQASLSLLTLFILSSVIVLYFLSLKAKTMPTWLLTGAFAGMAGYAFLCLLDVSVLDKNILYLRPVQFFATQFFLATSLQFAYRFPHPDPRQLREARLVLLLCALIFLFGVGLTFATFHAFSQNRLPPFDFDTFFVLIESIWLIVVLVRRTILLAENRHQSVWTKLLKPQGRAARAMRAFTLVYTAPLWMSVLYLAAIPAGLETRVAVEVVLSLGLLWMNFSLATAYLNHLSESSTFLVKLVGAALVTILSLLGVVGSIVEPIYVAAYHNGNPIPDQRTLEFVPDRRGGYMVATIPFHFDAALGQPLALGDEAHTVVPLGFSFPFYDRAWSETHVNDNGVISFGGPYNPLEILLRVAPIPYLYPNIAALIMDLDTTAGGGIFQKSQAGRFTLTWHQVPEADTTQAHTMQLVLHQDGVIHVTFNGIQPRKSFGRTYVFGPLVTGIQPGTGDIERIHFSEALPYTVEACCGVVEDYYRQFRSYLHQGMLPLAYLILGATILILVGFPLFFHASLVKPLLSLRDGVQRVNTGDLEVVVPVYFSDEIGTLAIAFNDMAVQLRDLVSNLEQRVAERTQELEQAYLQLQANQEALLLSEKMASLGRLTAGIAHEMNTPLAAVQTSLFELGNLVDEYRQSIGDAAVSGGDHQTIAAEMRQAVDISERSISRALSFIRSIKSQTRQIDGEEQQRFNVVKVIGEAMLLLSHELLQANCQMVFDPQEENMELVGSAVGFTQVVTNLISNAIDASIQNGGGLIKIELSSDGECLKLSVSDQGMGIPEEIHSKIFDPMFTTKPFGEAAGLGLTIVHDIVTEGYGGTINVESQVGEGATFLLRFPQREL